MLDDEVVLARAPDASESRDRFQRAKRDWEKAERAFRQSVAVLCGIVESESRSFPEAKMPLIEAELRACFVRHRASSRRDFAQSLQDLSNQKCAELVAIWFRELANPAETYVQDSITRFNACTSDIIQRISGLAKIDSGSRAGQAEGSSLTISYPIHSPSRITKSWFRRCMLRRAVWQLRADVETTVNALGHRLVEQIQHRAATVRENLQCQLEKALSEATESTPPDSEPLESPLLVVVDQPASAVLLAPEPAVAQLSTVCPSRFRREEAHLVGY